MRRHLSLLDRYYRWRSAYWRLQRILFPSPAEVRFVELMGGKTFTLGWLKSTATHFPFTLILSRGKILRKAGMRREYRIGKCYADFGNDINWIIEIDGTAFHRDVVADFDREVYMREFIRARSRGLEDLRIMRIGAPRVYNDSARLQRDVLKFLLA